MGCGQLKFTGLFWLLRPEILPPGRERDNPFTHRKWILAAALGNAGRLAGNPQLTAAAAEFAKEGLALQMVDGENPERGGFDVSYQMVDALQGARYYTSFGPIRLDIAVPLTHQPGNDAFEAYFGIGQAF